MQTPTTIYEARRNLVALHEEREAFFGIQQVARVNSKAPKDAQERSKGHLAALNAWAEAINRDILVNLDYLVERGLS